MPSSLGHGRLGQALLVADAADARSGEDFLFSHSSSLTGIYCLNPGRDRKRFFTDFTDLHRWPVKANTGFPLFFGLKTEFHGFACAAM